MKQLIFLSALCCSCVCLSAASSSPTDNLIRIVNLQTCLDASKTGKAEVKRFEALKKQLEEKLVQKEKKLNELSPKFTQEYLDSITPEEEKKLKDEFQKLSQEFSQEQSSYYQTLNQTQMEILQKMQDRVMQASKAISKDKSIRLILRHDACLFCDDALDLTADVISWIDAHPEQTEDTAK